ncbi:MAG: transcriptional regulator NrdR [Candidatus Eremiobacteraeota bacterium]|nr:transcriptional regulator NrdR [Candidatus Eremiobacteraeota bacterium]
MKCPYCAFLESKVLDSRVTDDNTTVRRRRQCLSCSSRFTTYERIEDPAFFVIKKDERRERFDRSKIFNGILKACEKRPIGMEEIERIVSQIEREIKNSQEREVSTEVIGHQIMEYLKDFDHVAYVRFASVYKEFDDITGFLELVGTLTAKKAPESPRESEQAATRS